MPSRESAPKPLRFEVGGGVTLVADGYGDPSSRPVVLLHGGGQTRHAWGGTARSLARLGWYAIALDLRGHGDSTWCGAGNYALDAFAGDLREVLRALGRPAALVGASLGGMTALLATGEEPRAGVVALVLVDIAPRIESEGVSRIVSFMLSRPDGFGSLEEAADAVAAYQPHRDRPRDTTGLEKNLRLGADGRWRWHWDPRFLAGVGKPQERPTAERLDAAAQRVDAPTLLVRGRLSDLLSEAGARHFLELAPHARYVDVSGAGHMVAGDRNDAFTRAVSDFLDEIARSREPGDRALERRPA